jgi:hypothetical protein
MQPKEQNAVNENVAATLGRPIMAFPEQDHLAHLATHVSYLMSPTLGQNPLMAPAFIPTILNHFKEHIALWYATAVVEISSEALGQDIGAVMKELGPDTEDRRALDRMLAEAAAVAAAQSQQVFANMPQIIQQAQQIMAQFQPQPVPDPKVALEQQKLQQQAQLEGQKLQVDAQKMQLEAQESQQDAAMEAQKLQLEMADTQQDNQTDLAELQARVAIAAQQQQAEDARKQAELQARLAMNAEDNATAMQLAAAEIASGERVAVSTGTGINPNPNQ